MPLLSFRVISCHHKANRKPYVDENERELKKETMQELKQGVEKMKTHQRHQGRKIGQISISLLLWKLGFTNKGK